MLHITLNEFERDVSGVLARARRDHETIEVTDGTATDLVVMDAAEYRSLMETLHLLQSPANAERLRKGMKQHQDGSAKEINVAAYLD